MLRINTVRKKSSICASKPRNIYILLPGVSYETYLCFLQLRLLSFVVSMLSMSTVKCQLLEAQHIILLVHVQWQNKSKHGLMFVNYTVRIPVYTSKI